MQKTRFIKHDNECYMLRESAVEKFKEGFQFVLQTEVPQSLFDLLARYGHRYTYVYKLVNIKPLGEEWQAIRTVTPNRVLAGIYDLEQGLKKFQHHRRLRVFYNKGLKCANPRCNAEGHYLLLTIGTKKNEIGFGLHVDVFTKDLKMMTIDHIKPRSKGGSDDLSNLRPMCYKCNSRLGNSQAY